MTKTPLSVKHQYNAGDLIASLPGFNAIYQETGIKTRLYQQIGLPAFYYQGADHPIKNEHGQQVCINQGMFDMMNPLIVAQPFIESFEPWVGQKVDIDFRTTRDSREMPLPNGDIFAWPALRYPKLSCDYSQAWIKLPDDVGYDAMFGDKIIINRTFRYTNPHISYYFLKKYEKEVVFAGVDYEYEYLKNTYDLNIDRVVFSDFLDAALALKYCKFFIGNQSFLYHLAESIKIPRILEVCSSFPNTWPHGANGYPFTHQDGLEYYVEKLYKNP